MSVKADEANGGSSWTASDSSITSSTGGYDELAVSFWDKLEKRRSRKRSKLGGKLVRVRKGSLFKDRP